MGYLICKLKLDLLKQSGLSCIALLWNNIFVVPLIHKNIFITLMAIRLTTELKI